ncbi:MAG: S-layer protein [Candidatus Diapherotrites archaeon]
MNALNIKKLAAVATGAALLGTAVAPIVSAIAVQKSDIYGSDGAPKVNIVVGSKAAVSDGVWAGNLAAKIAEKAVTTRTVNVSATTQTGETPTANLDLSDLTVDVTVGGTVRIGGSTKRDSVSMSSNSGVKEIFRALDGTNDSNALTNATLPHLFNESLRQKVNNGDQKNAVTNLTVQEKVGANVDVRFDQDSDIKDLIAKIGSGDFTYQVTLGSSASGLDLGSTSFTDGSDDAVQLVLFGEKYELSEANLGSQKYLKLVKSSARESYKEGDVIEGLIGDGEFKGKEMKVKVEQIVSTGAATTSYQATFKLLDSEDNVVDTRTVSSGENLKDVFKDRSQSEALASNLYIDTIATGATTGVGYVEVTKGTNTIEIYDNKVFPYSSTHTGSNPYIARIGVASGDANALYSITISNSAEEWDEEKSGFDQGPLYPTRAGQSLTGKTGSAALFGQYWPDGTIGKGYVKVELLGFEGDEERTEVKIGKGIENLPSGTNGGLTFYADDDGRRYIPFYIKVNDTNGSFQFEGKDISVFYDFGDSKAATNDVEVKIASGDTVNGRVWTILTDGPDANIVVAGVGTFAKSNGAELSDNDTITVDGVTFKINDANTGEDGNKMVVAVDTAVEFFYGNVNDDASAKNGAIAIYNAFAGGTYATKGSYGRLLLSNNSTFDGNSGVTIGLYGNSADRRVYYAAQYNTNDLWLLLDADDFGAGQGDVIQNNHAIRFLGTTVPNDSSYTEVAGIPGSFAAGTATSQTATNGTAVQYGHYVPKLTDFNNAPVYSASDAYFVAEFVVNPAAATNDADVNVYIDTKDGSPLGPFPIDNLSSYSAAAKYLGTPSITIRNGTDSTDIKAAWTDNGSKIWVDGDTAVYVSMPQNAEKVEVVFYGSEVTREVSGGENLTLKLNEEKSTSSGTKVILKAVNGGKCDLSGGTGGAAVCKATPDKYVSPVAIRRPLVYVDTDPSLSGTNIVVGGHMVNKLASKLADRLTKAGDRVAEVDSVSGNIYVAGYTAEDTGRAVQELIDEIDKWEVA